VILIVAFLHSTAAQSTNCTGSSNGASCNDGNPCTRVDTCQNGVCVGGSPMTCPAPAPCHGAGMCDPQVGACVYEQVSGGTCSDNNACTQTDACVSGVCVGSNPIACTAKDQCYDVGICNPSNGICENPLKPDDTPCNDNDSCTQTDTCQGGWCIGDNPVICTAFDQCHDVGICDNATGLCTNPPKPEGTFCDDRSACTQVDGCMNGTCVGTFPVVCTALDQCHDIGTCDNITGQCSNPVSMNGTSCYDGNNCTQTDTCQGGVCVGSNPVICTVLDQCHLRGVCDGRTGVCIDPLVVDGVVCNDNSSCTRNDECHSGVCAGTPVSCTAIDSCHLPGVCGESTGTCSAPLQPDHTTCDDSDGCTTGDVCISGTCTGSPVVCTAMDRCHVAGVCAAGSCSNPFEVDGTSCDDQNPDTVNDVCTVGVCAGIRMTTGTSMATGTSMDQGSSTGPQGAAGAEARTVSMFSLFCMAFLAAVY